MGKVEEMIFNFIGDYQDKKFLHRSLDVANPFAYFYIMAKVHKKALWQVCPGLGRWLDQQT
jgi:hypothetical protein